jgi:hypothetical protein
MKRLALVPIAALCVAVFALAGVGSAASPVTADLKITKTDSPDPVRVGQNLTYTIGVEDQGPSPSPG